VSVKTAEQETVASKLINRWQSVGEKVVLLAEEFPENKYKYKPVERVRSVADVFRHVAFWNQFVADSARGQKADDRANELPEFEYGTKAKILAALKRSIADATSALREHQAAMSPETAEMLVTFIEHNCEHYGQLVVYARINGIVPPVSRT
jgi:uncharacterized damage-inducible protein DinB